MSDLLHKQQKFTFSVAMLIEYINQCNFTVTFGECYRPPEMAQIYAKQGKGIVHSRHCERLAVDLNLFDLHDNMITDPKVWEQFGKFWEAQGKCHKWGGRFVKDGKPWPDLDHFEMD